MRDYNLYLMDIIKAMDSIEMFVEEMGYDEFHDDD
jgi:uncharacterized protein with HEPN domain